MNRNRTCIIFSFMLIVLMVCVNVFAASSSSADYPDLNVSWIFDGNRELFNIGFTDKAPVNAQNVSWSFVNESSSIELKDFSTNNVINHRASASVYIYWGLYSNSSVTINVSASGPLTASSNEVNDKHRNEINWKAVWQPMGVNESGRVVPSNMGKQEIGRLDNTFGDNSVYKSAKTIFSQDESSYPVKSKYGYSEIYIETQNTKSSEIADGSEKVTGNYYCSMYLDVIAD